MSSTLATLDQLLRSPNRAAEQSRGGAQLQNLALASLGALLFGAGLFGAVLASSRGGLQLLYSGLKLPLAILGTLIVSVPALYALARSLARPLPLAGAVSLALSAAARGALVLSALAPVAWLAIDRGLGYHGCVLLAAICYAIAGVSALRVLFSGVGGGLRGAVLLALCSIVVLPAGGQTAWMLRPFVGRPAQAHVPFLRHKEGSFADSLLQSGRSSVGLYRTMSSEEAEEFER
ncbi:MAG TPA: hypothetical protein VFQ61_31075 [Polyangiaceae bacterium]|nr:hypothetical protein [Polyangiaceae bacterium]